MTKAEYMARRAKALVEFKDARGKAREIYTQAKEETLLRYQGEIAEIEKEYLKGVSPCA